MAAPDNAVDILPVSYQLGLAAITFLVAAAGIVWQFLIRFRQEPEHEQKIVLERAELADMNPLREFLRDFRPALEKISRVEQQGTQTYALIQDVLEKLRRLEHDAQTGLTQLNKMEHDARVAKEVREELARELDRQGRRNRNRDDDI